MDLLGTIAPPPPTYLANRNIWPNLSFLVRDDRRCKCEIHSETSIFLLQDAGMRWCVRPHTIYSICGVNRLGCLNLRPACEDACFRACFILKTRCDTSGMNDPFGPEVAHVCLSLKNVSDECHSRRVSSFRPSIWWRRLVG